MKKSTFIFVVCLLVGLSSSTTSVSASWISRARQKAAEARDFAKRKWAQSSRVERIAAVALAAALSAGAVYGVHVATRKPGEGPPPPPPGPTEEELRQERLRAGDLTAAQTSDELDEANKVALDRLQELREADGSEYLKASREHARLLRQQKVIIGQREIEEEGYEATPEKEAAAAKIQALHRGIVARRTFPRLKRKTELLRTLELSPEREVPDVKRQLLELAETDEERAAIERKAQEVLEEEFEEPLEDYARDENDDDEEEDNGNGDEDWHDTLEQQK